MMKPLPHFINTDGKVLESSAVNVSRKFGEK